MTTYEYKCYQHGKFEVIARMGEAKLSLSCPVCGQRATRSFSPTPVHYTTGGFYSIDSGKRFESQLSPRGKEIYEKAKLKAGV